MHLVRGRGVSNGTERGRWPCLAAPWPHTPHVTCAQCALYVYCIASLSLSLGISARRREKRNVQSRVVFGTSFSADYFAV